MTCYAFFKPTRPGSPFADGLYVGPFDTLSAMLEHVRMAVKRQPLFACEGRCETPPSLGLCYTLEEDTEILDRLDL